MTYVPDPTKLDALGRVYLWSVHAEKWIRVAIPDATEMLANGSASLTDPEGLKANPTTKVGDRMPNPRDDEAWAFTLEVG